jgi:hypothetical protein
MRWVPWALGLAGIAQHAVMAMVDPTGYVSLDTSYLVMWLAIIGGLVVCYIDCCGWGSGGCGCCGDGCTCGDCGNCTPGMHKDDGHGHGHEHGEHGHEGHMH